MTLISLTSCGENNVALTGDANPSVSPAMLQTQPEASDKEETTTPEEQKKTAKDGADTQTVNPDMPTRVAEGGTRISMRFGATVIPGILNDSATARA